MRNLSFILIITFLFSVLTACSPDGRDEGSTNLTVKPTAEFPRPKLVKEEGYKIARGATEAKEINLVYDSKTKSMRLKGKIEYIPMQGDSLKTLDFDLSGVLDDEGFIKLKKAQSDRTSSNEKIVAKATCLSEAGTCTDSFIDIYIYSDGVVYHHQIESHQELQDDKAGDNNTANSTKPGEQNQSSDNDAETDDELGEEDDLVDEDLENEAESDDVEGEPGQYIGSVVDDIRTLLEIEPENQEQDDSPNKEGKTLTVEPQQNEEAKPKAPEKETPKKEEPKKNGSKKDQPKGDVKDKKETNDSKNTSKQQSKKDENKTDASKDDSKNIESKKEESKAEVPKKEEPAKKDKVSNLKVIRQAIGSVNNGHLENGVDVLSYEQKNSPTGFHIVMPTRKTYFAANEMMHVIAKMGYFTKQFISGHLLFIGDISSRKGGKLGKKHKSHQNGLDADIAYFFNKKSFNKYFVSAVSSSKAHPNWMAEEQWILFKNMIKTEFVDRIFVHRVLKNHLCSLAIKNGEIDQATKTGVAYETLRRLRPRANDHHDHFHLRVKCSKAQSRCRPMAEPKPGSGCF